MTDVSLRGATAADRGLLARATLDNLNWNGPRFTMSEVEDTAEFRHYYDGWPTGEDFGLVAEDAAGCSGRGGLAPLLHGRRPRLWVRRCDHPGAEHLGRCRAPRPRHRRAAPARCGRGGSIPWRSCDRSLGRGRQPCRATLRSARIPTRTERHTWLPAHTTLTPPTPRLRRPLPPSPRALPPPSCPRTSQTLASFSVNERNLSAVVAGTLDVSVRQTQGGG